MQTVEILRKKIRTAEDLLSVVKTMKSLAAVNMRHYERAVESLAEYSRTVELGLRVVLRAPEAQLTRELVGGNGQVGAVVFGSDQGLCGQFNERIATFALEKLAALPPGPRRPPVIAVGGRSAGLLEDGGARVIQRLNTPASLPGITPLVQDLLLLLERVRSRRQMDSVLVFHNRPLGGAAYAPQMISLLPVDLTWLQTLQETPWPSPVLPIYTMGWTDLFTALIRQHMFVVCYRACAESLAAEEASRLVSMQSAERNIEERLVELTQRYYHQRQNLITAELLDIVAGFEAVTTAAR
jgi:F-type H+-transporting ATPase subunit gamma